VSAKYEEGGRGGMGAAGDREGAVDKVGLECRAPARRVLRRASPWALTRRAARAGGAGGAGGAVGAGGHAPSSRRGCPGCRATAPRRATAEPTREGRGVSD
jgi:hypothetical protein